MDRPQDPLRQGHGDQRGDQQRDRAVLSALDERLFELVTHEQGDTPMRIAPKVSLACIGALSSGSRISRCCPE